MDQRPSKNIGILFVSPHSPWRVKAVRVKYVGALTTLTLRPANPYIKPANFLNVLPVERLEKRIVEPQTRLMNLIWRVRVSFAGERVRGGVGRDGNTAEECSSNYGQEIGSRDVVHEYSLGQGAASRWVASRSRFPFDHRSSKFAERSWS